MAQAIVQRTCKQLRSAIEDEATTRWNLTRDLQEMVGALEAVKPLLYDAERRSLKEVDPEPQVREWVRRVRKNAYLISDLADELQDTRRTSPSAGKVTSILPCLRLVRKKNQMADKMNQMMEELRKIVLDSGNFGFTPFEPPVYPIIEEEPMKQNQVPALEEEKIVGREEEIKSIIAACDTSDGTVILPIDGQEGSGKTALARTVFNHSRFKHHSRVWVPVLQEYGLHNIGNSIISQLSGGVDAVSNHEAPSNQDMVYITKRLRELLNNCSTKVLVVLDGLGLAGDDYIQFKLMFGVGDKSSKVTVILTQRRYMGWEFFTVQPIELRRLTDDMCWTIIKQTSGFEGRPESDKEKLEQIGRKIANMCSGLPREAKLIGAILRYRDATGWEEGLKSEFRGDFKEGLSPSAIHKIAYSMMPSNLRLCYAYCAIFPKGHTIVKDCLIHQWIALHLIEPSIRFSATQIAEEYIRSLVDLSLLQIMKPASTSGNDDKGAVVFSVHEVHLPVVKGLLRNFVEGLHDEFILLKVPSETCHQKYGRYAVLMDFDDRTLELWPILLPQLRAIHSVGCRKMDFRDDSFSSARCLRVLELKDYSTQELPKSVCQLRHLGCLNLSGCCGLVTLPDTFGDLLNLVYINLSRCYKLKSMPKSLGKLTYLKHIDLSGCSALVNLPESLGKLINLVHINLSGCSGVATLPESFGKLINLEHVGLSGCSGLVNLPRSFGNLTNLVPHISLAGCSRLVSLPESFGKLTNLVRVDLSGCSGLLSLPHSFGKLTNLLYLDLSRCHALGDLPHLEKLQHLNLSFWSCSEVIRRALGGLTSLQHLDLSHPCSSNAQNQPQHLQGLQEALASSSNAQNQPQHLQGLQESLASSSNAQNQPQHLQRLQEPLTCSSNAQNQPQRLQGLQQALTGSSNAQNQPQHLQGLQQALTGSSNAQNQPQHLQGLQQALTGSSNSHLQWLQQALTCSSNAQNQPQHWQGLQEALGKLEKLKYLNLSMLFHSRSEVDIGGYMKCISGLTCLEHLDLSHNVFLRDVPESLAGLSNLHTLDLSGCIRLKTVPQKIYEMDSLKLIVLKHCRGLESYQFEVGADHSIGNFVQLEDVNCQKMEISSLEKIKSMEEARSIRLREKGHLAKLKLCWTIGPQRSMEDNALLGEVVPPHSLQFLELRGYWGGQSCLCLMGWWSPMICPNLEEVTLEDVRTCTQLPPLGLLPNLQRLVLRRIERITRIDARDLCFGNRPTLKGLTIDDMPDLQDFNTRYHEVDGGEELMFPAIDELVVQKCPCLMFVPLPPRAHRLVLEACDQVMCASWWTGGGRGVEGPPCTTALVTELVVQCFTVRLSDWNLLHHLDGLRSITISTCAKCSKFGNLDSFPAALSSLQILCFSGCRWMESLPLNLGDVNSLRELRIDNCINLEKFPDSMQQLTSLESIHLIDCIRFKQLPEWLGDLTSLEKLSIHKNYYVHSLPESIRKLANLKDLHISDCSGLKKWCERVSSKKILAHIRPKYEKFVFSEPATQSLQNDHHDSATSNIGYSNEGRGDGSEPCRSSQHPSSGLIHMQPSIIASSSQRPNATRPLGSPHRDIYLT